MKVQLVSFRKNILPITKLKLVKQIYNASKADLVLFPGHSIENTLHLNKLASSLKNKYGSTAFIELHHIGACNMTNWSFKIENNVLINCKTNQQFTYSTEIERNPFLAENLLQHINTSRLHEVKGKLVCLLICGEINILKNIQTSGNRVEVRTKEYKRNFNDVFQKADVIFNPLHTPMRNQGKMKKRREYLSSKSKSYFSTANLPVDSTESELQFSKSKSLQYAFYNRKPIKPDDEKITTEYISRIFCI